MANGFNTGYINSHELNYIDPLVATPKKGQLLGRTLFQTKTLTDPWTQTHQFRWKEHMGQSSAYSDRATDITTTDVTYHEETGYIEEQMAGIEYTQKELNLARKVGLDVLGEKTQAATEALAEWEDRLIFNGNGRTDRAIYGLTSDPSKAGFQVADSAPITIDKVVDPTNADTFKDAYKLVNYFMDCAEKITMLPGYGDIKPVLLLPPKEYNLLNRPLINQYTVGQSIMKLLQNGPDGSVFKAIKPVEELKAEYWNTAKGKDGKRNMGMIYIDGPDTADIVVAMEPQRYGQVEYSDRKYKLAYLERMGGLRIKFPAGFVRIDGLNDGSEKWAK